MVLKPAQAAALIISSMEKKLRNYIEKDCKLMKFFYTLQPGLAMGMINKVMSASEH